jgi:hypothetical protein
MTPKKGFTGKYIVTPPLVITLKAIEKQPKPEPRPVRIPSPDDVMRAKIEAQKLLDKAIKGDVRAAQKILTLLYGEPE